MNKYIIIASVILIFSCKEKAQLGEYVYIDNKNVIHIDTNCERIKSGVTRENVESYETDGEIRASDGYSYYTERTMCPLCVDDNAYTQIMNMRNEHESNNELHKKHPYER